MLFRLTSRSRCAVAPAFNSSSKTTFLHPSPSPSSNILNAISVSPSSALFTIDEHDIAHLKLASPPVNALTSTLLSSLHSTIKALPSHGARAIILSSSVKKVFSAGLDLNTLLKKESESDNEFKDRIFDYMGGFQDVVAALLSTPLPTVAVVEGNSPAGGTVLCLCCDYRIAPEDTEGVPFLVGLNETAVGMTPPMWIHHLIRFTLASRTADRALQMGLLYHTPQDALKAGYVDLLVPRKELTNRAVSEIQRMFKLPWIARSDAKIMGRQHILDSIDVAALERLHVSLAGDEFQGVVGGIMEALRNKKAQKKQ
ncbi:dodecenoyl-CoA isomerase [Blyttiomyces sp. JEL0837]|nr:dodecenoyl-CoA isomerase [Blyttiomyces sp. JEL0837]